MAVATERELELDSNEMLEDVVVTAADNDATKLEREEVTYDLHAGSGSTAPRCGRVVKGSSLTVL